MDTLQFWRCAMRTRVAMLCSVVAVACVMGFVPMVEAEVVYVYNESVSGDVDGHAFTFDVGINTISGYFVGSCRDCYCGTCGYLKVDQFDFSIPAHTELVEITASFPLEQYAASFFTGGGLILVDPRSLSEKKSTQRPPVRAHAGSRSRYSAAHENLQAVHARPVVAAAPGPAGLAPGGPPGPVPQRCGGPRPGPHARSSRRTRPATGGASPRTTRPWW